MNILFTILFLFISGTVFAQECTQPSCFQPRDKELTGLAATTSAPSIVPYFIDAEGNMATTPFTAYGRSVVGANNSTELQAIIGVLPGAVAHVIENAGTPLTQRSNLNFTGAGVTATDAGGKTVITIPGGGAGHVIQEEGSDLPAQPSLNFTGTGMTCTNNAGTSTTDCAVTGGHTIQDEGKGLPQQPSLNLVGAGVSCANNAGNSSTDCTIATGAEGDPIVGAVNGIVKSNGAAVFSAATADVDFARADADTKAYADNSTNGLWVHTGAGTGAARTIVGVSGNIVIANGDGVSAAPSIDLGSTAVQTDTATTFGAVSINANAATRWGGPLAAGITISNNGDFGYDSTAHVYKGRQNGVTSTFFTSVNLPTALATNGTNANSAAGLFAIGVDASGNAETAAVALGGAAAPSPGTCPFPGAMYKDTRSFVGGSAGYSYNCNLAGGNFSQLIAEQSGYSTILGNTGSATGTGGVDSQVTVKGDGTILTSVAADASPDTVTMSVVNGSIPPSKQTTVGQTGQFSFHVYGTGAANVIEDTQDEPLMFDNQLGTTLTITQIKGQVDTGTTTFNIQRNDGSAANICTSDLIASNAGVTCTLSGTEKVISPTHKLGLVMVTGATSGTPTHLLITITYTKGDS